jgi:WD40 repeat protein
MRRTLLEILCALLCCVPALQASDTNARPTLFTRKGGSLSVTSLAISPSGKFFVTAGQDGVTIWSTEDGLEYRTFRPYDGYQAAVGRKIAVASDGQTIALADGRLDKIHLIDAQTIRDKRQINLPPQFGLWSIATHPKQMVLAYVGLFGNAAVAALDDGHVIFQTKIPVEPGTDSAVRDVRFSPDGSLLAITTKQAFQLWNWAKNKQVLSYDAHAYHAPNLSQPIQVPDGPQKLTCTEGNCTYSGPTKTSTREEQRAFFFTGSSFSPDGRRLALCSGDELNVLDIPSGKKIVHRETERGIPPGCVFKDKDMVFLAQENLDLGVYFISKKRFSSVLNIGIRDYLTVPGMNRCLLDTAGGTYLVDPTTFKPLKWLVAEARPATALAFTSTAELLWGTWFKPLTSWNLDSGEALPFPAAGADRNEQTNSIALQAVSGDGRHMAAAETIASEVRFFDLINKRESTPYAMKFRSLNPALSFSTDGGVLAVAQEAGDIEIIDAAHNRKIAAFTADHPVVIAAEPDGKRVAVGDKTGTTIYTVSEAPKKVASVPVPDSNSTPSAMQYSPDGRWLAVLDPRGLHIYASIPGSDGNIKEKLTLPAYPGCMAFSPAGDRFAFPAIGGGIAIANFDGKILFHDETALSTCPIAYAPDGRVLAVATQYGVELLSSETGSLLASLYLFGGEKELDWVVTAPDGLFDGTPAAWKQLVWRLSENTFDIAPVEIFFRDFYRPGLLAEIFTGHVPAAPVDIAEVDMRQPQVRLSSALDGGTPINTRSVHLKLAVTEALADAKHRGGSGVRDLRLFRNGTLVEGWRGDLQLGKRGTAEFDVEAPIVVGENLFTAHAFSSANIKSPDATLTIRGDSSLERNSTAYVIVMGVDHYAATSDTYRLDLKYAEADATDFAEQFRKSQAALRQFTNIRVIPLIGANATRENLETVLGVLSGKASNSEISNMQKLLVGVEAVQPEDGVFIFYAGHGVASNGHFYFIPQNYNPNYALKTRDSNTISELDLSHMLEGISPARSFLIIDACHSGQAIASDMPVGPVNSPGLAQLAYEKGLYIVAASSASEPALETQELGGGHGFLTYALVEEGLKTSAAAFNGTVELRPWFAYASRRVPELESVDIVRRGFEVDDPSQRDARQHPRMFYRREPELQPFIVAKPDITLSNEHRR